MLLKHTLCCASVAQESSKYISSPLGTHSKRRKEIYTQIITVMQQVLSLEYICAVEAERNKHQTDLQVTILSEVAS